MPIVEMDVKGAGHRDDQLMQGLVSVTTAFGSARDVVQVVDTLDVERDVYLSFNECQIASGVVDPRKFNDLAVVDAHV